MLSDLTPPSLSGLRAEHGISLIELLVAMASATVVTAAVVTVLQVGYNQETRTTDHTQANQIGRTAMNSIVTELNSSCTGIAPIQYQEEVPALGLLKTGPLSLWLTTVYGTNQSGDAELTEATKQDIQWTETEESKTEPHDKLGKLLDYEFKSEGTDPQKWTFPLDKANMKTRLLAENVIPVGNAIFHYYHYNNGKLENETPSSVATAEKVSKVSIAFEQAPVDGDTRGGRVVNLADAINLRLDPSESGSEGPCE